VDLAQHLQAEKEGKWRGKARMFPAFFLPLSTNLSTAVKVKIAEVQIWSFSGFGLLRPILFGQD